MSPLMAAIRALRRPMRAARRGHIACEATVAIVRMRNAVPSEKSVRCSTWRKKYATALMCSARPTNRITFATIRHTNGLFCPSAATFSRRV